ncbi:MAG: sensor domain-containing diguanylate cyclase [Betaproteobacteria bacterium]|nr:MAG: sensor domain-containing diguanylate cyclase [Betaproteobacteria bacterium]
MDMAVAMGVGLQMVVLLFVGLVAEKAARHASDEQGKRHAAAEALRQSNERLALSNAQTQRQTREVRLMAEMGRMLQASAAREDLFEVIGSYARELFPAESGALYIYSASRDDLDAAVTWGGFPAEASQRRFAPGECWALRQGQAYHQDAAHAGVHCPHVKDLQAGHYLCVPLMAHGETLGVLHLRFSEAEAGAASATGARTIESLSSLAASVAEYVALAIANQQLRDTLRNQAIRDQLTGLFNRRYAEETLARELQRAARKQTPVSLIFLDLDHFKLINDTYGHDAGDVVLQKAGIFLKTRTRGHDVACRYGGEEFLLVMPDASLEVARQRAEVLREGIRTLGVVHKTQALTITASFGVAAFPDSGADRDQLLKAVDTALYEAKSTGRNRVVTANPVTSVPAALT